MIDTLIPPLPPYLPAVRRMNAVSLRRSVSTGLSVMARQLMVSSQLMYWGVRPVKLTVHRKTSMLWGFQTNPLTPPLYFFSLPLLVFPLFLFTACSLSVSCQFLPPSSPSVAILEKEEGNSNIYSCRYVPPPTYSSQTPTALQNPDWSPRVIIFNNKQATHQAADKLSVFFMDRKMDRLNVSTQVIIRPHLFNEIRLSAPGKELRKQNALPPSLI